MLERLRNAVHHALTPESPAGVPTVSKALEAGAVVFGIIALVCSIHSDVFLCVDSALAQKGFLLAWISTFVGGATAALSALVKLRDGGRYRLWQPFRGGLAFTILQYFGWLFFGVSLTMYSVFLVSSERIPRDCRSGTIAAVGCLAFASILTLLASTPKFDPEAPPLFASIRLLRTDNLVVVACLGASMVFSVLIEADHRILRPYRNGLTASLFTIDVVAVFLVVWLGRRRYKGQKIFHPFQGGFYFVLMQSSGWAGVGVAAFFFLRVAVDHMFPGMLIGVTFLHGSATMLLLLSLDCFEEVANLDLLKRFKLSPEIVAMMLIGMIAFVTITICDLAGVQHSFLYHFAMLCQVLVAPVIHVYASIAVPGYRLWQPFSGGSRFIVLHGIGWALYAISHMILILALWNSIYAVTAAASLFVVLVDVILCVSLHVFSAAGESSPAQRRISPATAPSPYLNGELITSLLLSIGGFTTLAAADVIEPSLIYFEKGHICIFGIIAMLLAPPLAQFSGRHVHPRFRPFKPFFGGPDHVALQTVGWTLWGITVVGFATLEVNLFLDPTRVPLGTPTIAASLSFFSFALLVTSIPLFHPDESVTAASETPTSRLEELSLSLQFAASEDAVRRWRAAAAEAELLLVSGAVQQPELRLVLQQLLQQVGTTRTASATSSAGHAAQGSDGESGINFLAVALSSSALILGGVAEVLQASLSEPLRTAAVGPCCAAMFLACIGAACITHFISGTRRFPMAYQWWMPFGGGANFSLLQTIGWALISVHICMFFSAMYALHATGDLMLFVGIQFATGFFGFSGHMFLVVSLSQFDPHASEGSSSASLSFLHRNSEWFLGSILTVMCIAALTVVETQIRSGEGITVRTVPVLVAGILAFLTALGLGWASAWKSLRMHPSTAGGTVGSNPPSGNVSPSRRALVHSAHRDQLETTSHATLASSNAVSNQVIGGAAPQATFLLSEIVGGLFLILWILRRLAETAEGSMRWAIIVACVLVLHHVVMFLTIVWSEHRSFGVVVWELISEVSTFTLYGFHFVVIAGLIYIGFMWKLSVASVIFFVGANALSLAREDAVRSLQVVCVVCMLWDLGTFSLTYSPFLGPLLLYTKTYSGAPQIRRNRYCPKVTHVIMQWFWDAIANYFSLRVVGPPTNVPIPFEMPPNLQFLNCRAPILDLWDGMDLGVQQRGRDPKVIYAFHPHGVCPYTVLWGTLCSRWTLAGLTRPVLHVSSFLMAVPVVRDVLLAFGVADCTIDALQVSLQDQLVQSVMIVPGGLRECAVSCSGTGVMTLVTKHRGIFRFALQHGAILVPVFCFGETEILSSTPLPKLQAWANLNLGVSYPQLPHGRLLLPLPRRVNMYIAVGEGIRVTPIVDPRPAQVDALHAFYYARLAALFDEHKGDAGFPNATLELIAQ